MVDFRRKSKTPAYLTQRFQRRMLSLVCLLGLVFFVAYHAKNPGAWAWLFENTRSPQREQQPDKRQARSDGAQDVQGAFVTQLPDEANPLPDVLNLRETRRDELKDVDDNSTSYSYKERRLHYQILQALSRVSQQELEAAGPETVSYTQLHAQPEAWRAELVHIVGSARLAYRDIPPPDVAKLYGIDHVFEVWIQPPQLKEYSFKIYCLELPPDFPQDKQVFEPVEVTGLFFRLLFRGKSDGSGELHPNPVILARTIVWKPEPKQEAEPTNWPLIWGVIGGVALAALFVVLMLVRRAPRVNELPAHLRKRMAKAGEIDVFDLDNPDTDRKVKSSLADLEASLKLPAKTNPKESTG